LKNRGSVEDDSSSSTLKLKCTGIFDDFDYFFQLFCHAMGSGAGKLILFYLDNQNTEFVTETKVQAVVFFLTL